MFRVYAAAAFVVVFFATMSWPGLLSDFSHDDLMNMTFALRDGWAKILRGNLLFYSTQYRPLGGLFYLGFYDLFGLNPLPFRIAGIAVLGLNLFLLYRLARVLTGSPEAGLLAALVLSWHGNLAPLFYGSGNIYDALAFCFFVGALVFYVAVRRRRFLSARDLVFLAILHILALNSKEFAASLPLVLLAFELIFHPPGLRALRWLLAEGRGTILCGSLSAVYCAGKLLGADSLASMPAYAPKVSGAAFVSSFTVFLNDFLYQTSFFHARGTLLFIAVLIVLPLMLRNRAMLFAAALTLLGPLPVMLIEPRGLAGHYLTVGALLLWAAVGLSDLRSRLVRIVRGGVRAEAWSQAALFAIAAVYMLRVQAPEREPRRAFFTNENRPIRVAMNSMQAHPEWFSDRPTLVISDPFPDFQWASVFIAILTTHRYDVPVQRLENLNPRPDAGRLKGYAVALRWERDHYVPVDPLTAAVPVL